MPFNNLFSLYLQISLLYIYPLLPYFLMLLGLTLLIGLTVLGITFGKKHKKTQPELRMTSFDGKKIHSKDSIPNFVNVADLNKDLEPFGFAYYPPQDIFYSNMVCWQRECGYCEFYDEASAALSMIIDCEPIYFNYEGKKWLIEFWKGQYGLNTGCEIGIYTTTGPNLNIPGYFNGTFYHSAVDEDRMVMGFSLYKNGKLLFYRKDLHWWLTGFKLGEFSNPSELVMHLEITLKNSEMRDAFIGGLKNNGYTDSDITIMGNTISLVYDKPHYEQPSTRTPFIENFMQANNERNCAAYQLATKPFSNTLDKLNFVRHEAPKMYRKILNVGSTKELFAGFEIFKNFLSSNDLRVESIDDTGKEDSQLPVDQEKM